MELEVLLAGVGRQLQGHLHDPHGSHATYGVVDHVGENVEAPFPSMLYTMLDTVRNTACSAAHGDLVAVRLCRTIVLKG